MRPVEYSRWVDPAPLEVERPRLPWWTMLPRKVLLATSPIIAMAVVATATAFIARRVWRYSPAVHLVPGPGSGDVRDRGRERGATMHKYLTVSETAAYLNTSERFVRRLIAERRIAFHHVGKHVRFALIDLDEWLATGRVEPITTVTVCHNLRKVA